MSSNSYYLAVVLAVIWLPVILLSMKGDAQPTVDDETSSCSASTLEEVATEIKKNVKDEIKGVKQLIMTVSETKNETSAEEVAKDIKDHMDIVLYLLNDEIVDVKDNINDMKALLEPASRQTNETTLEEVANMVKIVASNQQQNAKEIGDVKRLLGSGSQESNETTLAEITKDIEDVKTLLGPECRESNDTRLEEVVHEVRVMKDDIAYVKTLLESVLMEIKNRSNSVENSTLPCEYFLACILLHKFGSMPFCLQCFDAVGWAAGRASGR